MEQITRADIQARIARDNPWWANPQAILPEAAYPRRVYFAPFKALALNYPVKRATILLGPRRVGKTVMTRQLITDAISDGIDPRCILYASVDTPIYLGLPLEQYLALLPDGNTSCQRLVVFDEIQYLKNWKVHLKDLVDNYPNTKFVATGSAAAALQLQSRESGAGRFSDFMLPPLTFYEFLLFTGDDNTLIDTHELANTKRKVYLPKDIEALNSRFIDYLNYGGYPEVVLNPSIQSNADQFVRNDIIDKVLLKDLPSLYGIREIPELNKLFSFLAYNAGNEASLENISQESGLTKPTITRYIEYLESAFLLMKLTTVNDNCRTMKRERHFKIYLNNPSMRAALFAPVKIDDTDRIGHLTKCAIFSQWQHSPGFRQLRYARWRDGEVDIVYLDGANERPGWIGEIKWSDRIKQNFEREIRSVRTLLANHDNIRSCFVTTKTYGGHRNVGKKILRMTPSALYCYTVGRNIMDRLDTQAVEDTIETTAPTE